LQNASGAFVQPSQQAFAAAATHADWDSAPGMGVILSNEPGADSWPVTAATFILIPRKVPDAARAHEVLKFFDWAWREGGKMASELDYVPLPDAVTSKIRGVWTANVHAADGKPIRYRVTIDGKPPGADHGMDTDADGNGTVTGQRLYQLVRQANGSGERLFKITFLDPGVRAYAFTFG